MTRGAKSLGLVALLAFLTIGVWSLLFRSTFDYPLFWDDLHFIRCYPWSEIRSTFHGPNDPDQIETAAYRPVATLMFDVQGCLIGENVRQQRTFMAGLMGLLLCAIGLLLHEVGLSTAHTAVVFLLFASSRVFASVMLWMTLSSLIVAYVFMLLAACFYIRWASHGRKVDLLLLALCAVITTFAREEAYTLPLVLPLLWRLSPKSRGCPWRRALGGSTVVLTIVAVHFTLREIFIRKAPRGRISIEGLKDLVTSVASAWCPGGLLATENADWLLSLFWKAFLCALVLAFMRLGTDRAALHFAGACALGAVLCAPALGVARSFGIALPTVAFFTATSIAIVEVVRQTRARPLLGPVALCLVLAGLAVGVVAGIRRSGDVADSLHENCATRLVRDGSLLLDPKATIPVERRQAGLERLASVGIRTREDVDELGRDIAHHPRRYRGNREARSALFLPKYDYKAF